MQNGITSYLQPGRLADVLALIQVLAYDDLSYRTEVGLQLEMQRDPTTGGKWIAVAAEHPEFFRVRTVGVKDPRVALLSRYVLQKEPTETGEERRPPLDTPLVNKLMELAIDLHDNQLERRTRWRTVVLPILVALVGAAAALAATIIKAS